MNLRTYDDDAAIDGNRNANLNSNTTAPDYWRFCCCCRCLSPGLLLLFVYNWLHADQLIDSNANFNDDDDDNNNIETITTTWMNVCRWCCCCRCRCCCQWLSKDPLTS